MKRKKRLEKGIGSLEEQISVHKKKLENAKGSNEDLLINYYQKEIEKLEKEKKKKVGKL